MRIDAIKVRRFVYKTSTMRDTGGHTHPGPERDEIGACYQQASRRRKS